MNDYGAFNKLVLQALPIEYPVIERIELAMIRGEDTGDTSCRYAETGDKWVATFMDGGVRPHMAGKLGDQPDWLRRILDVARIGGHIYGGSIDHRTYQATNIVWFRVDEDYNLTEFIDWM